eukprot:3456361-Ditylum_brightwellii.AAC.1
MSQEEEESNGGEEHSNNIVEFDFEHVQQKVKVTVTVQMKTWKRRITQMSLKKTQKTNQTLFGITNCSG